MPGEVHKQPVDSTEQFQSFKITNSKSAPPVIAILVFFACLTAFSHYPIIAHQFPYFPLILIAALFLTLILLGRYTADITAVELYDDKIVIKGKHNSTVLLADIRELGRLNQYFGTYTRYATIRIKLNNGQKLKLTGNYSEIQPLLDATCVKIQHLTKDNRVPIKKLTDWVTLAAIFTCIIFLSILALYSALKRYGPL